MITISLQGILQLLGIILIIVAIVAVVVLIKVLSNVNKSVESVSTLLDKNKDELESALRSIPVLTAQLQDSLTQVNEILDHSSESIVESIAQTKNTLVNATRISADVADTVEYVATTAVDTADMISSGVGKSNSTLGYIREIATVVRDLVSR